MLKQLLLILVLAQLAGCDSSSKSAQNDMVSADTTQLVADIDQSNDASDPDTEETKPLITLPQDEGLHSDQIEWWYYTGLMKTKSGKEYGFEYVIFQAKYGDVTGYLGHFAVTDVENKTFHFEMKSGLSAPQQPQQGFNLAVGDWTIAGTDGTDKLVSAMKDYSIDLTLKARKPVVFQYGNGAMTLGSDEPFYYYTYPRMAISGTLTVKGEAMTVTGDAWMDHQWGSWGKFDGWDWFSLRFDDDSEVMLFKVRGEETFVGGTIIHKDGTYQKLEPNQFKITETTSWTSPHNGGIYPMGWRIEIADHGIDVTVTPLIKDQEVHESVLRSPKYWEGLCSISGTKTGHAYVELTGYDK